MSQRIDIVLYCIVLFIYSRQMDTFVDAEGGKGRRCGPTNRIVNNSDFNPSEFDHQYWSDSDYYDEIILSIAISIFCQSIFD